MDPEIKVEGVEVKDGEPAGTPPAATEGAETPAESPAVSGGGKNVTMSARTWGENLQKERDKGKRSALTDLEKKAKDAGFASLDAMFAHTASITNGKGKVKAEEEVDEAEEVETEEVEATPPKVTTAKLSIQDRKIMARNERELERHKRLVAKLSLEKRQEEKRRQALQQRLDAQEARAQLEKSAILAGVKDVDYAVSLLTRQLDGKSEEELKGFNEGKFFEDLRNTQPYLFGETVRPATTGTGVGNPPSPPKPGQVSRDVANAGQIDVKKMDRAEYDEHLRKRGINPHSVS